MHHVFMTESEIVEQTKLNYFDARSGLGQMIQRMLVKETTKLSKVDNKGKIEKLTYYYIDFPCAFTHFLNTLVSVSQKIDEYITKASTSGSYRCSNSTCQTVYSDLDVIRIFNSRDDSIVCEVCRSEVNGFRNENDKNYWLDIKTRFNDSIFQKFSSLMKKCVLEELREDLIKPDFNNPNRIYSAVSNRDPLNDIKINFNENSSWSNMTAEDHKEMPIWLKAEVQNVFQANLYSDSNSEETTHSSTMMMAPGRIPGKQQMFRADRGISNFDLLLSTTYNEEYGLEYQREAFFEAHPKNVEAIDSFICVQSRILKSSKVCNLLGTDFGNYLKQNDRDRIRFINDSVAFYSMCWD